MGENQYTKAKRLGLPKPIVSPETSKKFIESGKRQIWNEERRKKHSNPMKLAVEKNPNSYTSANRGRTKQIEKYGIKFQGRWELEFYEHCLNKRINIQRPNIWFSYEWNGTRKYFPDFYLPDLDTFVEIKGYETERDRAKWSQFPRMLIIIKAKQIKEIRNKIYSGP